MHCTNCGKELSTDAKFCNGCGKEIAKEVTINVTQVQPTVEPPVVKQEIPQQPVGTTQNNMNTEDKEKCKLMSTWAYVGSIILMAIPIIGWIFAIVWACGGTPNKNKRNLARATIILFIIGMLIMFLIGTAISAFFKWAMKLLEESGVLDEENMKQYKEFFEQFKSLDLESINVEGLNIDGMNIDGMNIDGMNVDGMNIDGVNMDGVNIQELPSYNQ